MKIMCISIDCKFLFDANININVWNLASVMNDQKISENDKEVENNNNNLS